jgi:hypothetical protein
MYKKGWVFVLIMLGAVIASKGQENTLNKVHFGMSENGYLGGDFPITYGDKKISIATFAGIWIAARDSNNNLHTSVMLGPSEIDFGYGPYNKEFGTFKLNEVKRTWRITEQEISNHIQNYKQTGYVPLPSIAEWPANPPPRFEGPLAAYFDWNNNQKYEPDLGEYPYIEGDEAIYAIYNDKSTPRVHTGMSGMGLVCKHSVYAYQDKASAMQQGLLMHRLVITNRSNEAYSSLKLGVYIQTKLGLGDSSFIRTFPPIQSMAAYSNRQIDSTTGEEIPQFALMGFKPKPHSMMYILPNDDVVTGLPSQANEVENYLSGRWRNGKQLTYGGNGVDGANACRFVFPNNQDPAHTAFSWTEENSGSQAGERLMLMNFEAVDLLPNESQEYRFGFLVNPIEKGQLEKLASLESKLQQLYQAYHSGELTSVRNQTKAKPQPNVYPNPYVVTDKLHIQTEENLWEYELMEASGKYLLKKELRDKKEGRYEIELNVAPGLYWIKMYGETSFWIQKLIVY